MHTLDYEQNSLENRIAGKNTGWKKSKINSTPCMVIPVCLLYFILLESFIRLSMSPIFRTWLSSKMHGILQENHTIIRLEYIILLNLPIFLYIIPILILVHSPHRSTIKQLTITKLICTQPLTSLKTVANIHINKNY